MVKHKKTLFLCVTGILLVLLFISRPAPSERLLNIQNYLITVGGIISGFVIAYLSGKIFNTQTEKRKRQEDIDSLGKRLTAYRQLMYFVMNSRDFWVRYGDIKKFKNEFDGMTYQDLQNVEHNRLSKKFWLEENNISKNTISLYTAMECIYDRKNEKGVPWAYDRVASINYSLDELQKYYEPSNQIWYYLDGRYEKHGRGLFNDNGISPLFVEKYKELVSIGDPKHKGKDFHRLILAELGSEFYEFIIPQMAKLIKQNSGIPRGIKTTFINAVIIMVVGVIGPIILQATTLPDTVNLLITKTFVGLTIIALLNFLLDFYHLLEHNMNSE